MRVRVLRTMASACHSVRADVPAILSGGARAPVRGPSGTETTSVSRFGPDAGRPGRAELPHDPRVHADLVPELLEHADDHAIARLDPRERLLESPANAVGGEIGPARREHLVGEARLLRGPDHPEHPVPVAGEVDLPERDLGKELRRLVARAREVVETRHVV